MPQTEEDQGSPELDPVETQSTDQGSDGVEQTEQGTVDAWLNVGNQKFKDGPELSKAYSELQKGFTQKNQEYTTKLKSYEGFERWLSDLKKDEAAWGRFVTFVRQGNSPEQAAQKVEQGRQGQAQPSGQEAQEDPRFGDLEYQMTEVKAAVEYQDFRLAHKDMDQGLLRKVVTLAADKADGGDNWSLEMCYRWIMSDPEQAAKLVNTGQEQAKASLAKGQAVRTLGGTPSAPQAQMKAKQGEQTRKSWYTLSEREQRDLIESKLKKLGANFEEEV